jgi:hypothetical protein
MTVSDAEKPPVRDQQHRALEVFLGKWRAEGTSYGSPDQDPRDPKGNGVPWTSTHEARWYTGDFFLIQDEKARPGGEVFDTLSVMGVDAKTGRYFARSFENHGFYLNYVVERDGDVWTLTGDSERARIEFRKDGREQVITWEWRPKRRWLPLCDRVATRID